MEWLKDRKQRVVIRGTFSDWISVLSGVPQGSVLGPILFLVYINNLDYGVRNWILKFADDTKIFSQVSSPEDYINLQKDLNSLVTWAEECQMLFNVGKCKVMQFGRVNKKEIIIRRTKSLRLQVPKRIMGIVITSDLKFSEQCSQAYSKASRVLGMIKRTIVYKSADTLVRLYKSLVRPHLEYCTAAWSPHYLKDRKLLEKIQRRFTRMVPGLQELPYESRLISLKLCTLDHRRVRADLIELFKMVRGLSTVDVNTFFEFDNTGRTRGEGAKEGTCQH